MPYEIAVFLDTEGNTTQIAKEGIVKVFAKKLGTWHLSREKEFSLQDVLGMVDLRAKMEDLLTFLAGCPILVGSKINGVPSVILGQANCKIKECAGKPDDFLDRILQEEESLIQNENTQETAVERPEFIELSPGYFRVSVKEIQENNTKITTKQALLPFVRQGKFRSLEIICSHVPQWIEGEVFINHYSMKTSRTGEGQISVRLIK
jgi:Fe-only nitrogenase accessory protein AnfO